MGKADSLGKTLMLGKTEGRKRTGQQRRKWLDGITDSMNIKLERTPGDGEGREAWRALVHGVTESRTRVSD